VVPHLPLEVVEHVLLERHVLEVPKLRIGFGVALPIGADLGLGIPLGEGTYDRLHDKNTDLHPGSPKRTVEVPAKLTTVPVESARV